MQNLLVHHLICRLSNYLFTFLTSLILFNSSSMHFSPVCEIGSYVLRGHGDYKIDVNFCSDILYVTSYIQMFCFKKNYI